MPHTTYALFKGIRNHSINSPTVASSVRHGVPNACNLCHLDQTLAWTDRHLSAWYGHEMAQLSDEQQTMSAALLWLLKGDAAQRVIAAWHFGWEPAQQKAGTVWMAPHVAQLLNDPYGVVRYVAHRSLGTLPGFDAFEYDFMGPESERTAAAAAAVERWESTSNVRPMRPHLLLGAQGRLQQDRLQALVGQRNNRPVRIKE
jgi:hypothetical protein